MTIVKYRKIFFGLSIILVILSLCAVFVYGFNFSIDFKGGSITEVSYPEQLIVEARKIREGIETLGFGGFSVRSGVGNHFIIRTKELNTEEAQQLNQVLSSVDKNYLIERQNTVGPLAGAELKSKAVKAVSVVMLMIVLFITFAFRKVSKPVSSWKYGLATIIALVHDVIVPTGIFVLLGHLLGIEIDLLFVSGLLAILGYSVHDTIVVFDRVRENLRVNQEKHKVEDFEETVGHSVSQTMARSINTSLTLLITLIFLYFIGSTATRDFSLLLIIGVVAGTYSSIFLASPLLVTFYKLQGK